ncbi:hypothetical protein [Rhabdochlamydiaceae symbiont of Dictyostelium giganteum]|uniref:hypothetical protein n=1 Tax=Rhabdochlamydiaceae symbiont of Dictyostelium giganteum TaxID=3342349 RepID=UPI00384D85E7
MRAPSYRHFMQWGMEKRVPVFFNSFLLSYFEGSKKERGLQRQYHTSLCMSSRRGASGVKI